jgi:xanthine/uracil permease
MPGISFTELGLNEVATLIMRKPIFSNKEVADMASGMGNVLLGLACLVLIPYLVAPLFGGKFLPLALIRYGCWIGIAFIMKYGSRYQRDKIRMKPRKWYFISTLMILFTFVWWPNYLGLILSVLLVVVMMASYKAQGKQGWQDEQ